MKFPSGQHSTIRSADRLDENLSFAAFSGGSSSLGGPRRRPGAVQSSSSSGLHSRSRAPSTERRLRMAPPASAIAWIPNTSLFVAEQDWFNAASRTKGCA